MWQKFKKKPVEIHAFLFDPPKHVPECLQTVGLVPPPGSNAWTPVYCIETLEGRMRVEKGDWIICGVKGEFYPCKPDIFEMTYEPVKSEDGK